MGSALIKSSYVTKQTRIQQNLKLFFLGKQVYGNYKLLKLFCYWITYSGLKKVIPYNIDIVVLHNNASNIFYLAHMGDSIEAPE